MSNSKPKIKCLFASANENFLKTLRKAPELSKFHCYFAQNGGQAQQHLKDNAYQFNLTFIDLNLTNPSGIDVIKFCHIYQAAVPLFLFAPGKEIEEKELEPLGVESVLDEGITPSQIADIVEPHRIVFDEEKAIQISKQFNDKEGEELAAGDKDFIPVQASNFISGKKSFFDIYVRLKSGKFIKILNAGDDFNFDRIKSYIEKGVTYFFIRKESQQVFVDYINKTSEKIFKHRKVSVKAKTQQLMFLGEETGKLLSQFELDEQKVQYAADYVDKLHIQLKSIKGDSKVNSFLNNVLMFEHCSGVSFVAGLLAKELNVDSYKSISILGLGAIMHDIGLYKYKEGFSQGYEDVEYFDEENIELRLSLFYEDRDVPGKQKLEELENIYIDHPTKGATIVSSIPNTDPLVAQIIRQHHLRRNGTGISQKRKDEIIHPLSELAGISDEFIKMMKLLNKGKSMKDIKDKFEQLNSGFSMQTHRAFREVFFSKKTK